MVGKVNALSVFAAWTFLVGFFVYLAYEKLLLPQDASALPLVWLFGLFVGASILHMVAANFVRCPSCRKCLTVQGFGAPHPSTSGSWAKVAFFWFSGRVQCIHCGATVDTKNL
jgi:hypothetical protein